MTTRNSLQAQTCLQTAHSSSHALTGVIFPLLLSYLHVTFRHVTTMGFWRSGSQTLASVWKHDIWSSNTSKSSMGLSSIFVFNSLPYYQFHANPIKTSMQPPAEREVIFAKDCMSVAFDRLNICKLGAQEVISAAVGAHGDSEVRSKQRLDG